MKIAATMEEKILQLQEELAKVEHERCKALEDLEEIKWRMRSEKETQAHSKNRIESLELELEKTRESERRMLESLACQTKQLEQTKMHHEEAKLEIKSLHESIHDIESSKFVAVAAVAAAADAARGADEVGALRMELWQALAAEEKSKKAMDDLAMALKEVTTESSYMKEKLCQAKYDVENARGEEGRLTAMLRRTESKLRMSTEELKRLKVEAEESFAAWQDKETVFLDCMKVSEEEVMSLKRENARLVQAHKSAREEISKLRDIMKQAINEASVVKGALEIARRENSQFQDVLAEKDDLINNITQDLECVKASEATALEIIKELQSLLVASSSLDLSLSRSDQGSAAGTPRKKMAKYPSENWRHEDLRQRKGRCRSLGSDSDDFDGSILDSLESPRKRKMDQDHAAGAEEMKNSSNHIDSGRTTTPRRTRTKRQVAHGEEINSWESPSQIKMKKKQILRKFGELLRRSVHSTHN